MGELSRIGIAIDSDLLKRFDRSIEKSGYTNRSEAFRDLIRDRLVREHTAAPNATVLGIDRRRSANAAPAGEAMPHRKANLMFSPDICTLSPKRGNS